MRDVILEKLKAIEKENTIIILYAVESGSRGWGFASRDSDYDVRFIYVHPVEWYLSIDEKKDFIEVPINDELDINGWDLKKALLQYKKSNPSLMEWLSSPIVYRETSGTAQKMRDLLSEYFMPVHGIYHYLHIAKNKYEEVMKTDKVKIKRYFYILRPVLACMWIEKNGTMPPMAFSKLMADQTLDQPLLDEIHSLLEKKALSLESDIEPKSSLLLDFLGCKIKYYSDYLKSSERDISSDYAALNALFCQSLKELWGAV